MTTLKAVLAAIVAVIAFLVKVMPDWSQKRQAKIDALKAKRAITEVQVHAWQAERDSYILSYHSCPDWVQKHIDADLNTIREYTAQLKALGAE